MTPPSIRQRLSRLLLGVALAWGLAVSVFVWLGVRHEVRELLDDSLQSSADVLHELLQLQESLPEAGRRVVPGRPVHEGFAWQVVAPGASVLLRSALAPETAFATPPATGFFDAAGGWRVYGVRLADDGRVLYVAQTGAERDEAMAEVGLVSVCAALAVGLAVIAWLRARLRRELAPVAALSAALAHYEPLAADATLAAPEREELVPMHDAVLALGRRLAQRVLSERAFSAHAAHALRTPLAGIDAQLAVALREAPPALAPRLQQARAAAARLSRVVGALLTLFRSGARLDRRHVDLAELVARLPAEGLEVIVEPPGAAVDADADLLAAAFANLLDNAVRHGARRATLTLNGTTLVLLDDGEAVDDARRQALQAALARDDDAGPLGLGLRLADLVARAHGGALALPRTATGFAVELRLAERAAAADERPSSAGGAT